MKADIDGQEEVLNRENIKCYQVGYVQTQKPYYTTFFVGLWPDPLEEKSSFSVKRGNVQPIWIEVFAPKDIKKGEYSGTITLKVGDKKPKDIKLKVEVWGFCLPKETSLQTAFGFYPPTVFGG